MKFPCYLLTSFLDGRLQWFNDKWSHLKRAKIVIIVLFCCYLVLCLLSVLLTMAYASGFSSDKIPSVLEQMLSEISYHRTREIAQYAREGNNIYFSYFSSYTVFLISSVRRWTNHTKVIHVFYLYPLLKKWGSQEML